MKEIIRRALGSHKGQKQTEQRGPGGDRPQVTVNVTRCTSAEKGPISHPLL